jgi:hypothetical protein
LTLSQIASIVDHMGTSHGIGSSNVRTLGPRGGPGARGDPWALFVNDQWGYGSVTTAIVIADELEGRVGRMFAGSGPGFELARRSGFDRLVQADTMAETVPAELEEALGDCQVVVSVMNQRVARLAAERGIPCAYVDSLLWMWPDPPDVPGRVPYFQERFPGADEALERWRERFHEPELVGPLVARAMRGRIRKADAVLVNFGGLSCSLLPLATLVAYADAMAQCVATALDGIWAGRVVVAAGRHILDRMDVRTLRALRPNVDLADLSHEAYLAELRRSAVLFSSAGMHAIYEAGTLRVPCICLPAQNLSNALAIRLLRRDGVADAMDWEGLYGPMELDRADEAAACRRIADRVRRFTRDTEARMRLVEHLRERMGCRELARLRWRQAQFLRAQGRLGAPRVAERTLELLPASASMSAS